MMNKTNAKQQRMETLKNNGVNVDNFFNLSMQIPFGAEVVIKVDGKEMVIPANNGFNPEVSFGGDVARDMGCICGTDMCRVDSGSYNPNVTGVTVATNVPSMDLSNDKIVKSILDNGYVYNYKTAGRFVAAQTFRMINGESRNFQTGKQNMVMMHI